MELNFFNDFRQSLQRLNCLKSPTNKSLDLQNMSSIFENIETFHSRTNSYTQDDPLSKTVPIPSLSQISGQLEADLSAYKQLTSSIKSNNLTLFRKFLHTSENLEYLNKKRRTFLHISAKYGSLDICQLILAYSEININSRDQDNKSPLHLAAINGQVNVVKFLTRCGGYLHIKDKSNKTVIDYAIESKNALLIQFVFDKSPSLCKLFGFNIQDLLKAHGVTLEISRKLGSDEKGKVKKVEASSDEVGLNDFLVIREIGRGSFGVVFLVKYLLTGEEFALKVMTKEKILTEKLEDYVFTEKNVMAQLNSEFIVKLKFAFQTPELLCLVMDYCSGGTLADVIRRNSKLDEEKAKKYLSEIVLALESLHSRNIIYRDLKPENILIDQSGHIRLTDFGLAKTGIVSDESAASFCGTVSYLAPEIIEKRKYGKSVDWYSFGVLLFELITGAVPKQIHPNLANFPIIPKTSQSNSFKIPKFVSASARNLIEGLLCEGKKRIGFKSVEQVKLHEFFADVDWEIVRNKGLVMDKPKVKSRKHSESPSLPTGSSMKYLENWTFCWSESCVNN